MTELLYLDDAYLQVTSAIVTAVVDECFIVLNRTVCYAQGGGQPGDTGVILRDGKEFRVLNTMKKDGVVVHEISESGLTVGEHVTVKIDWPRRYMLMRYHTAAHVLSAFVHGETGALISGNQISDDKLRVDYSLEEYDPAKIAAYIEEVNSIMAKGYEVTARTLPREEALQLPGVVRLASALPPNIPYLRIVRIGDDDTIIDEQADGGTHVKNTKEVGVLELVKLDNKGKNNRRVTVKLKE